MKNILKKLPSAIPAIIVGVAIAASVFAFQPLFPQQGGTGTGTAPAKGSVLVGASSTAYGVLSVGANGKVLTASSTATNGVSWETVTVSAGVNSLNGSTSSTQTFATSGPLLSISTANGVHTFTTLATSSLGLVGGSGVANQVAYFSAATTLTGSNNFLWDGVSSTLVGTSTIGTLHLSALSSNPQIYPNADTNTGISFPSPDGLQILVGGTARIFVNSSGNVGISTTTPAASLTVNGSTTITSLGTGLVKSTLGILGNATSGTDYQRPLASNEYVSSTACNGIVTCSASTGAITISNNANYVSSTVAGTGIGVSGAVGSVTITNNGVQSLVSGSSTLVSSATGTVTISSRPRTAQWTANYSTSTSNWYDDFFIFDSTSTIRDILVKQQVASPDTIQFNVCYSPTSTPVNSNQNCFNVLTTSTVFTNTTSTRIVPTASSTPGQMSTLRIFAQNASSTEFTMVVDYDVN